MEILYSQSISAHDTRPDPNIFFGIV